MAEPITPQFTANTVVAQVISINYRQEWDGVAWVIVPADITVVASGNLTLDGVPGQEIQLSIPATDLPPAGQAALQDLLQYMEQQIAAEYP